MTTTCDNCGRSSRETFCCPECEGAWFERRTRWHRFTSNWLWLILLALLALLCAFGWVLKRIGALSIMVLVLSGCVDKSIRPTEENYKIVQSGDRFTFKCPDGHIYCASDLNYAFASKEEACRRMLDYSNKYTPRKPIWTNAVPCDSGRMITNEPLH